MKLVLVLTLLSEAAVVLSQSFLNATSRYPQLSNFRQLLLINPVVAGTLLTNTTRNNTLTILVPSNTAFENFRRANNNSGVDSLRSEDLTNVVNYHTLQGALSSSDLQRPTGLIANSALTNPVYANRELSSDGSRKPQVVFIGTNGSNLIARQLSSSGAGQYVESGEGRTVNVDPTDGVWDGGRFHIIDGFLTLPLNQTDTMTAQGLNSFVRGLDRTNVTIGTNAAQGLTCVCPNDRAFANYGALDMSSGNLTDGPASLLATLTRHGLTGSFYTTDFFDGQMIRSQNGYPIRVTNRNGSIFLNDAQIVGTNYIANNGAVHALDRVMGYLNATTNQTTPANSTIYSNTSAISSPTPISSSSPSSTVSSTSTAVVDPATTSGGSASTSGTAGSGAARAGAVLDLGGLILLAGVGVLGAVWVW